MPTVSILVDFFSLCFNHFHSYQNKQTKITTYCTTFLVLTDTFERSRSIETVLSVTTRRPIIWLFKTLVYVKASVVSRFPTFFAVVTSACTCSPAACFAHACTLWVKIIGKRLEKSVAIICNQCKTASAFLNIKIYFRVKSTYFCSLCRFCFWSARSSLRNILHTHHHGNRLYTGMLLFPCVFHFPKHKWFSKYLSFCLRLSLSPNDNSVTVMLPNCHSAVQTQTQTEPEAYRMH